ncbi:hypothetical protein YK48G_06880 [Lentilactobacillus fungorum]|uniref:Gram-positive cocci surface proteins LPxTG domain-containing protein n=1 Tax=Lentilactobacillus fungorum TaxID=2201250 RepID=A0ABQ3VWH8_9LACO|nr:LPXTG cell wall anchor domain-containing protein [Lentilactobacillus fungorum]GHP13263.1 hypothetical protein YK48G_06880 [Lentilactobacillus fungorum]
MNKRLKTQLLLATGALVGMTTATGLDQTHVTADEKVATTTTANSAVATTDQPTVSTTNTETAEPAQTTFQSPPPAEQTATDTSTPQAYGNAEGTETTTSANTTTTPASTTQTTETSQPTSSTTATPADTTQTAAGQTTEAVQQGAGSTTGVQVDQRTQTTQEAPAQQSSQTSVQESTPTATPQAPVNNGGQGSENAGTVNNVAPAKSKTVARDQGKSSPAPANQKQAKESPEANDKNSKQAKETNTEKQLVPWEEATGQNDERYIIYRVPTVDPQTEEPAYEAFLFVPKDTTEPEGEGKFVKITEDDYPGLLAQIAQAEKEEVLKTKYLPNTQENVEALTQAIAGNKNNAMSYMIVLHATKLPSVNSGEEIAIAHIINHYLKYDSKNNSGGNQPTYVIEKDGQYYKIDEDGNTEKANEEVAEAKNEDAVQVGRTTQEDIDGLEAYLDQFPDATEWKNFKIIKSGTQPEDTPHFTSTTLEKTYYKPNGSPNPEENIVTLFKDDKGDIYKLVTDPSGESKLILMNPNSGDLDEYNEAEKVLGNNITSYLLKSNGNPEKDILEEAVLNDKKIIEVKGTTYMIRSTKDLGNEHGFPSSLATYQGTGTNTLHYYAANINYGYIEKGGTLYIYGEHEHYVKLDSPVFTYAMNERYGVKVTETTPPGPEGPGGPETPGPGPSTPNPDPTPDPAATPSPTETTPVPEMPISETPTTPEDDIELPQALPADDKKGNDKKGNNKKESSSNNKTGKTSTNKKDGVLYLKSNPGSGANGSGSTGTGLQALNAKSGNTFKYSSNDAVKPASASTNATHNTTQKDQELKTASMLPQTGDTHATNWLAVIGLSMLGLLGLAKFRKRRN